MGPVSGLVDALVATVGEVVSAFAEVDEVVLPSLGVEVVALTEVGVAAVRVGPAEPREPEQHGVTINVGLEY